MLLAISLLATAAQGDVDAARRRWNDLLQQDAALLAPRRHREAETALAALEAAVRGGNTDRADSALATAEKRLQVLDEAVQRARTLWADLLERRARALSADATQLAPREWRRAENVLVAAAQKLETGRQDTAQRQAGEAPLLYDAARLAALRATLMRGPRELLQRADRSQARQYAPRSYVRALDAASAAEKLLQEHGEIDADVRAAADRATQQAQHALYVLGLVRGTCGSPDQLEGTLLDWEESLQRAVQPLGQQPSFEAGFEKPLQDLGSALVRLGRERTPGSGTQRASAGDSLQLEIAALQDTLRQRDLLIAELRRLQEDAEAVRRVQDAFTRNEGRVLVEDGDILLRLHGLRFAADGAEITPDMLPLLDKVVQTVRSFPGATLVVEGHTDASAAAEASLKLTQQRAEAVRDYIVQKAGVDASKITAVGYGSSRPVAANDTEEGRALNQRIVLIIARPG